MIQVKKYLIFIGIFLVSLFALDYFYYFDGSLYLKETGEAEFFAKVEEDQLWLDEGKGFEVFDLKGVNLGLGKPGEFATDYAISEEEYLRWFEEIQDLGANTIRIYKIAHSNFYEAFYAYNENNPEPLYLIHGVWLNDYLVNSHLDAYDEEFQKAFTQNSTAVVDVIHGRHKG